MQIRLVKREDIDKVKWNSCVHYSNNGNIFGYIWYLDTIAKEWDALVEGDYESVFPLIWRFKYLKVKELYQPPLIRELSIYTINVLSEKRITAFLEKIPEDLKYIQIRVQEQVFVPEQFAFQKKLLPNYQLLLHKPYEELQKQYSTHLSTAIEKAQSAKLLPTTSLKPETIADFYKKHTAQRKQLGSRFHAYHRIMYNILHRGMGFGSGVQDKNGDLLAVNFYIYSHSKIYSLLSAQSPDGQPLGASLYLLDILIRSHANKKLVLDFNSSDLGQDFGAMDAPYVELERDTRKWGLF